MIQECYQTTKIMLGDGKDDGEPHRGAMEGDVTGVDRS